MWKSILRLTNKEIKRIKSEQIDWSDVKDHEICPECAGVIAGRFSRQTHRLCLKRYFYGFELDRMARSEDQSRLIMA